MQYLLSKHIYIYIVWHLYVILIEERSWLPISKKLNYSISVVRCSVAINKNKMALYVVIWKHLLRFIVKWKKIDIPFVW